MLYLTSDTHYGHVNVIKYCRRPFLKDPALGWVDGNLDVEAMDEAMIANWNAVVRPDDRVLHLGDVMMGPNLAERLRGLRQRLNGAITLLTGNHDRGKGVYLAAGFDLVQNSILVELPDGKIAYAAHHPPSVQRVESGIHFCGHVHEAWAARRYASRDVVAYNVGVDVRGFRPVAVDEIMATPVEEAGA